MAPESDCVVIQAAPRVWHGVDESGLLGHTMPRCRLGTADEPLPLLPADPGTDDPGGVEDLRGQRAIGSGWEIEPIARPGSRLDVVLDDLNRVDDFLSCNDDS